MGEMMRIVDLEAGFGRYLHGREITVADLDAVAAIEAMTSFYADNRLQDAAPADIAGSDGDMLLFQWGIYDSLYGAGVFTYGITRQAIGPDEDDGIWQLSLTLRFPATAGSVIPELGRTIPDRSGASCFCRAPSRNRLRRRPASQPGRADVRRCPLASCADARARVPRKAEVCS
ncbi:hypothetical protein IU486_34300 [Streptomyces gardneri]|uniref:hypothetical protein n=1 Tax=Nocardia TaxID=1817 RepID=UPI00135AF8F0|nr:MULTISPECIES: hypothetical protein [Nocardia]MBF6169748.1 hypothetical protein [Streptomyces gardneri]